MYARNAATVRRLNVLQRILTPSPNLLSGSCSFGIRANLVRALHIDGRVTIDDVSKTIRAPRNPEYVPQKFLNLSADGTMDISQTTLHHLRWMLQKDHLGQDMFLLGRPGPLRRALAMQYLQLTQRELEYVSLSRDTTESDLKQRREIQQGTATYFDQSAVRAATEGRILVIEGVEKAERNVLPVLNNLLENREMHLEDGRFLIPADRYDKLLEKHGAAELDRWGLVRVSEEFRVIALGLPVPRYRGAPLDPPLRSRFQSRDVSDLSYLEVLTDLQRLAPAAQPQDLKQLAAFGFAVLSPDSALPDFPVDSLHRLARLLQHNPQLPVHSALYRLYPYAAFLPRDSTQGVHTLLESLQIAVPPADASLHRQHIADVQHSDDGSTTAVRLQLGSAAPVTLQLAAPSKLSAGPAADGFRYVPTDYQNALLADIVQSYAVGDLCLIGPKGSGKSLLTAELARRLGQTVEPLVLYQDMTARDFVQQRTTRPNGDTVWRDSPLVRAARNGHIAVLDGLHRIHGSTVAVLHRLVHDRELQLYDGTRLLRHDKYDDMLAADGVTVEQLRAKRLERIHPAFRIVALGEPPARDTSTAAAWLQPEMLSLFLFHEVRNLSRAEELDIVRQLYGPPGRALEQIVDLAHLMRGAADPIVGNLAQTLSTRQLLRIAHRMSVYSPDGSGRHALNSAYDTVQRTFLAKFLPAIPRAALENAMENVKIMPPAEQVESETPRAYIDETTDRLTIGNTSTDRYRTDAHTKVPDITFYDVPQHVRLLELLLQDFLIGGHLLLVGNQGVGKNKLADRLLQLMRRPREYVQLHRDTTVQTLTVQPTVRDGVVRYEDSPLVRAVRAGHVLVVDEADKAPTHVTCILKTLVENGEMVLSDGRKIVPHGSTAGSTNPAIASTAESEPHFIHTHPDFRMIVLANRPGFPFLGNDFFAALGDLFSCHSVDNPSVASETYLLRQYGPDVPAELLGQLVNAFGELRTMADSGQLSYPYSTREVVNVVRHLQTYPEEPLSELVGNVLDFDRYAPESLEMVTEVLQRHGLDVGAYAAGELGAMRRKRELQVTVESNSGKDVSAPKHGKEDEKNEPHVGGNTWAGGSGGRDTAGMGGKGGPYRLDKGHKVHQLSDAEKDDIPESVKEAARAMNRSAFAEKLREIRMSGYDHSVYEQYRVPVDKQIRQLRIVLSALQAKSRERQWQKHQTAGELDDNKLVEGLTGERNIYRKRADQEPEPGQPQERPKRLKLVVDVSGSMYRFNGYDGRLDRELEAVVMVMEAFEGFEQRVRYDIVGHSGEQECIRFVDANQAPANAKERLEVIKMMHAHSQFCWSGDNTLSATRHAVNELAAEESDESIVIVLSDANLSRYGIRPQRLVEALVAQEPKVQAYSIFIGSLDDEAKQITKSMPAGRGFLCMNLQDLPQILKQIFASSVLHQAAN